MDADSRMSWLYELARAQTDHEQQISAELSTRGGLLAALAALIAVGLAELVHYSGGSILSIISCVLLSCGTACLLYASWGLDYERPASAKKWGEWARKQPPTNPIDSELLESVCEDYCMCAEIGIRANNKKAPIFNASSRFLMSSLFFLILALLWNSFMAK